MNKKITVKNQRGEVAWCIINGTEDRDKEIEKVFSIEPGRGHEAYFDDKEIVVRDYYVQEERARLEILSVEDTKEEPIYYWEKDPSDPRNDVPKDEEPYESILYKMAGLK